MGHVAQPMREILPKNPQDAIRQLIGIIQSLQKSGNPEAQKYCNAVNDDIFKLSGGQQEQHPQST